MCLLLLRGAGSVFRLHQARAADMRKGQRLGKNDRLVTWQKPWQKPAWLPQRCWEAILAELPVRVLRFQLSRRGFRPETITLVTTLVDARAYPAEEIARLHGRRWKIEL